MLYWTADSSNWIKLLGTGFLILHVHKNNLFLTALILGNLPQLSAANLFRLLLCIKVQQSWGFISWLSERWQSVLPAKMQVIRKLNNYLQISIISPSLDICSSMTGRICCLNLQYGIHNPSWLTDYSAFYWARKCFWNILNVKPRQKERFRVRSPGLESQNIQFQKTRQPLNL